MTIPGLGTTPGEARFVRSQGIGADTPLWRLSG